jgi:hypothetical protein
LRSSRLFAAALAFTIAAGVVVAAAGAVPNAGNFRPYVCTDGFETIPAGQELVVKVGWATGSFGNVEKFLDHQKVTLEIRSGDGSTVLASSAPAGFGDRTYWSAPEFGVGTIDGQDRSRWLTTYSYATGISLAVGEQVRLVFSWEVDKKLDDDFGYKINPGIIFETNDSVAPAESCIIQGA